ncbi:MAG: recombination regulator RecX [Burkholderiaceae bacterium]
MQSAAGLSLKGRALRCLATREHSRAELERKLRGHEETPGELAQVLDALAAKGFISEQRVADSVVNRRASKLGGQRLRQELQAKGLAPALVAQALGGLRTSEQARASEVWQRKFGAPAADAAGRARQMRFLLARGFEADVVRRVVGGASEDVQEG